MFLKPEELKDIDIFNDFYKIKCDAIFASDNEDVNILILLCTIHHKHYFFLISNETITVKRCDDDMDLYLCFDNQFGMKGYYINEELTIYKDSEEIFECNFFTIKNLEILGRKNILILRNKNFDVYPKKDLVHIAIDIFDTTLFQEVWNVIEK